MTDWFESFAEALWLQSDDTGEAHAIFTMKALDLHPGNHVLDIPCGAGRVGYHLAHRGCVVTGIDLRASFIDWARARFAADGLAGTFLQADIRSFEVSESFTAVINWAGSFGYFSDDENARVLRRMVSALHPGGRLLLDQLNRQHILRNFRHEGEVKGARVTTRWDADRQRIETVWILPDRSRSYSSIRLYTLSQLCRLFEMNGLMVEAAYGGRDGSTYGRTSTRLVLVGRKIRS